MRKWTIFAVVLFLLLSISVVVKADEIAKDAAKAATMQKCNDLFFKETITLQEIADDLTACKEIFPPEFHDLLERAVLKNTQENLYWSRIRALGETVQPVNETSNTKPRQVVELIKKNKKRALSFKEYSSDPGSFQAVYVVGKKRYTVYYTGGKNDLLSFWVRPNGTNSQKFIQTFTDHGLDGTVEFGISGDRQKLFDSKDRHVGQEYQQYWQSLYDQAITDSLKHFR